MLKQGDNIVTDIRLGGVQINTVYLGTEKVYPGLLRRDVGVHYDTGANTYQGWDRYNIYYYRDVLVWSNGTQTYENLRSENTLTRANAYTEADTLKSTGTSYWRSGWDKYRTDVYQTWRTREDGHADWVGAARDVAVLVQSNAYTEAGTLKIVGTSYWRSGWDKYRTDTWQVLRTAFDGYQEWVGATWGADVLVQSNAYTEARTHKSIGTSFWPSGWDKYRTDIYQTLRTAFDGYQEWVGAEEQVPVLVENNAYTLGAYYHESSTATVCINYGVAPYSTGYHRILARNRVRFDGYQEVNDRYTESNWQIVANNVVACGYNPKPTVYIGFHPGIDEGRVLLTRSQPSMSLGNYVVHGENLTVSIEYAERVPGGLDYSRYDNLLFPTSSYQSESIQSLGAPPNWAIIRVITYAGGEPSKYNYILYGQFGD